MIVPSALLNLTTLSPELREQLHDFLPIEFKNCLDSLNGPTIENLHAIHAHLSHLRSSLSATVPRWLLDTLTKSERPFDQSLDATVLLADVTGFTRVTAQLGALGRAGNEYLTYALNQAFKVAVRSLLTYGGDLLAFGGDALLAVFRGPDCAAAATTSAWQMQAALAALDLDPFIGLSEPLRLQIKIGLASGPLILAHVGSTTRRLTLALGQVLDTTDAIAGTTAPACIRLDYLTAAAVDSIAQLTAQADGSFLLSGLNRQLLLHSEIVPENIVSSIGALTAHVAELAPYVPLHVFTALAGASQARPGDGEQRHVISMFSHLTGLNALADTLGRERTDIAVEIAGLTIERAVNIIESYGGALARVDTYPGGHKLLALFGAPVAHEHDAERALRAAQALRDAMKQLNAEVLDRFASHRMYLLNQATHAQPLLNIRTGINAGLVVAGLIGSPERYEYTVMGDSVNVAARLMGKADLNRSEILIGESVYEQISDLLDAEACMLSLKGKRELLRAWSVQHVRMRVYPEPSQRPPLVGRDAERRIVRSAIDSLHDGKGQIVFIRGEAGVGKTRLVREIPVWLDSRIACVQTGSPGLTPVSFGLFRTLLLALAHAQLDVAQHTFSEQLDALIERFCPGHLAELRPSLAMLMRLDDADLTSASTDPAVQQRVLARSLQTLLSGLAMEQPFVWVCEDVHQADDASLAVLEQMITVGWETPWMLCATSRPATALHGDPIGHLLEAPAHNAQGAVTLIDLVGLDSVAGNTLLHTLLPDLASETSDKLHAYAGGNPLFLQVLAQTVQQQRMLKTTSQGLTLQGDLSSLGTPRTLRELVTAQVDHLPAEARHMTRAAAVIAAVDPVFPRWLLERIVDEQQAVGPRLRMLEQAQVIEQVALEPAPGYMFRHALYQQAAYDRLLERDRQELHRRVGLALHALGAEGQEARIEALAYHCYEGQCWELAADYSLGASRRARQTYANRAARRLLRRALGLARRLGRAHQEAEVREGLGELYALLGRYAPAQAQLERALRFSQATGDSPNEIEAQARRHRLLAEIAEAVGEYTQGEHECRTGLALVQHLPAARERLQLHEQLAIILMRLGDLDGAEQVCRDGLAQLPVGSTMLRERIALLQLIGDFDLQRGNHRVAIEALEECLILARQINVLVLISPILRNLGLAYYLVGERSKARDYYQESIHIDERIGNVGGVIIANDNLGLVYLVNGEYPAAHTCFQKAIRLSHAHNMPQRFANVLTNLGLLYFVTGDLLRAETTLLRSYTLFHELGEARSLADCLYQMGDVALARGDSEVALKYGEEALMLARQVGSTIYEAYSLRVIGEALLAIHQPIEAAVVLDQAQKFQSRIDDPFGRVLLLRATLLLAQAQGADQEAKRLARMGLELAHAQESPYLIARMQELD